MWTSCKKKLHSLTDSEMSAGGGGGGGQSLIWPIRGRASGQGMVFWPLCPEQGIHFYANLS